MNLLPKFLIHRFGYIKTGKFNKFEYFENTIKGANLSLEKDFVSGGEIDIRNTKDGVLVVTHNNVSSYTYEEIKKKNQELESLESWLIWFKSSNLCINKNLYLDLKDIEINPKTLLSVIKENNIEGKIIVGTKNFNLLKKLLKEEDFIKTKALFVFQFQDPLFPKSDIDKLVIDIDKYKKENDIKTKVYGVHFFFPDSLLIGLREVMEGHGQYVQFSDWVDYWIKYLKNSESVKDLPRPHIIPDKIFGFYFKSSEGPQVFPNILLIHNLRLARLKYFTSYAKQRGLAVFTGSTNSPLTIRRMSKWKDVDFIMINDPKIIPAINGD